MGRLWLWLIRTPTSWAVAAFRQMAIYHFDYRDNDKLIPDIEGTEVDDLETAGLDAIRTLAELAKILSGQNTAFFRQRSVTTTSRCCGSA